MRFYEMQRQVGALFSHLQRVLIVRCFYFEVKPKKKYSSYFFLKDSSVSFFCCWVSFYLIRGKYSPHDKKCIFSTFLHNCLKSVHAPIPHIIIFSSEFLHFFCKFDFSVVYYIVSQRTKYSAHVRICFWAFVYECWIGLRLRTCLNEGFFDPLWCALDFLTCGTSIFFLQTVDGITFSCLCKKKKIKWHLSP